MIRKNLPVIVIILVAICFSLGLFCDRLVAGHLLTLTRRSAWLAAGWLAVGGLALVVRAVRTMRHVSGLSQFTDSTLNETIRLLIRQHNLDSQHLELINSAEPQAFCYGFLKPRICLSIGLVNCLSPAQLEAVLLHEEYHRQHHHPLRILLLDALAASFFFLPTVGDWCKLQKIKLELAADRYAIKRSGKPALAGALHRLLVHTTAPVPGAVAGLNATEARVAHLLGERTPSPFTTRNLLISTGVILILCMIVL